jgi:antitoxin component YwqK of YwqJK toxin-antitoxin module
MTFFDLFKKQTTEIVEGAYGEVLGTKTRCGKHIIRRDDIKNGNITYSRYYKKGMLEKTVRYTPQAKIITLLNNKDNILKTAQTTIEHHNGAIEKKNHDNIMVVNGYPFAVTCCHQSGKIKAASMELI